MRALKEANCESTSFSFFSVVSPLDQYVSFLYSSEISARFTEDLMGVRVPEIEPQLVFVIEDGSQYPGGQIVSGNVRASLFLQPPHLHLIDIPGTIRQAIGASLRPQGLRLLFPGGTPDFAGTKRIALEDLCGAAGRALLEQLMALSSSRERVAHLRSHLEGLALRRPSCANLLPRALRLIEQSALPSVAAVAGECGLSLRSLRRLFANEIGLSPKQTLRLIRARRVLAGLQGGAPLSEVSAALDFADQAHMTREVRHLLTSSPEALRRQMVAGEQRPRYLAERELLETGLLILSIPRAGPVDCAKGRAGGRNLQDSVLRGS